MAGRNLKLSCEERDVLDVLIGKALISDDFAVKLLDGDSRRDLLNEYTLSQPTVEFLCSLPHLAELSEFVARIYRVMTMDDDRTLD